MLSFSPFQVDAFSNMLRDTASAELSQMVRQNFPDKCAALSDEELNAKVTKRLAQGKSIGLASRAALRRFVFLSVECGWAFDTDPNCNWMVKDYLGRAEFGSPDTRLNLLWDQYLYRLDQADKNIALAETFSTKSRPQHPVQDS